MRIEQIGLATLYLADCRDILPTVTAHVLITDPVWPNCPPGLLQGWDRPGALLREAMASMPYLTRAVIVMRHDCDPRFLAEAGIPMAYFRTSILPYVMPGYIGRKLGNDELAYCFGDPIPSAPGARVIPGRAPSAQAGDRAPNGHPCSRPLVHFQFLVGWNSTPEELVLDPFMGSGTTGVAATMLRRKFIGIEVEPHYFDLACQRIEQAQKQLHLDGIPA